MKGLRVSGYSAESSSSASCARKRAACPAYLGQETSFGCQGLGFRFRSLTLQNRKVSGFGGLGKLRASDLRNFGLLFWLPGLEVLVSTGGLRVQSFRVLGEFSQQGPCGRKVSVSCAV